MSKKLKLTPWFPGEIRPARPGVYQVSCRDHDQTGNWYGRFDGFWWYGNWGDGPNDDILYPRQGCGAVNDGTPVTWRGLAKEPK